MGFFKGKHKEDNRREAKLQLQRAHSEVEQTENEIKTELLELGRQVKLARAQDQTKLTPAIKKLLVRSANKRKQLGLAMTQRQNLEHQQDMLESSELNEKVFNSMKATTGVLKDLGVDTHIGDMDSAMMDLREHSDNAMMMASALSEPLTDSIDTEASMEQELALLLADDMCCPEPAVQVSAPVQKQRMQTIEETTPGSHEAQEVPQPEAAPVAERE